MYLLNTYRHVLGTGATNKTKQWAYYIQVGGTDSKQVDK